MGEDASRLLVTGFGPFAAAPENPAQHIAEALASEPGVRAVVLPVAYERAERELRELLTQELPSCVLMFGVHRDPGFALERVALNRDAHPDPDNEGVIRSAGSIRAEGPAAYWSTLPLREIADALTALGVPWRWSADAGGFLCNHAFYCALDLLTEFGCRAPCGFIHVPPPQSLPLATQVIAARACVDAARVALGEAAATP